MNTGLEKKRYLALLKLLYFGSLREQPTFRDATGLPAKWRLRNEYRNSILMTRHHPDLGSASDWLKQISDNHMQNPDMGSARHQCGISALIFQPFFSGGVAKGYYFSFTQIVLKIFCKILQKEFTYQNSSLKFIN